MKGEPYDRKKTDTDTLRGSNRALPEILDGTAGFEKTIDVSDGNKLSFGILQKGPVESMYQTYASAEKDVRECA